MNGMKGKREGEKEGRGRIDERDERKEEEREGSKLAKSGLNAMLLRFISIPLDISFLVSLRVW